MAVSHAAWDILNVQHVRRRNAGSGAEPQHYS